MVGSAISIGGFAGGAIVGAAAGATGGFVNGAGMTWLGGGSFGEGLTNGIIGAGIGLVSGAILGGTVQGFVDLSKGNSFWTGAPKVLPTAPNQSTTQTPAEKMSRVREMGRVAEEAAGIKGPKKPIPSLTETADFRIPDEVTSTTLREVKNVSHLEYTNQLKDFVQYSQRENLQMILEVRPPNTVYGPATTFSPAMNNAIYQHNIIVRPIKFIVPIK